MSRRLSCDHRSAPRVRVSASSRLRETRNFPADAPPRALDRDVFTWRGVSKTRDQTKGRLSDARADATDKGKLQQRRIDRLLMHQLLHLVQNREPFSAVEFDHLSLVEHVDKCESYSYIALNDKRGEPRRGIPATPVPYFPSASTEALPMSACGIDLLASPTGFEPSVAAVRGHQRGAINQ